MKEQLPIIIIIVGWIVLSVVNDLGALMYVCGILATIGVFQGVMSSWKD